MKLPEVGIHQLLFRKIEASCCVRGQTLNGRTLA
jgi:hypothetical protein